MNVERLIEALSELPGHYPVSVEVIVGGDLVTDDVPLERVTLAGESSAYVLLKPDQADNYGTRELIDEALEARARADEFRGVTPELLADSGQSGV